MRKVIISLTLLACLFLTGCGNLSPRDNLSPRQDINNQQGKIDKIEQNQQLLRSEIEKLALINKENNNSGVQILQGDSALFLVFGLVTIFLVIYYFYRNAEGERKTAEILAEQIARSKDDDLEQNVIKAAEFTDQEERILALLHRKKKQGKTP
jgi:hypothetical protein